MLKDGTALMNGIFFVCMLVSIWIALFIFSVPNEENRVEKHIESTTEATSNLHNQKSVDNFIFSLYSYEDHGKIQYGLMKSFDFFGRLSLSEHFDGYDLIYGLKTSRDNLIFTGYNPGLAEKIVITSTSDNHFKKELYLPETETFMLVEKLFNNIDNLKTFYLDKDGEDVTKEILNHNGLY